MCESEISVGGFPQKIQDTKKQIYYKVLQGLTRKTTLSLQPPASCSGRTETPGSKQEALLEHQIDGFRAARDLREMKNGESRSRETQGCAHHR
jgi:hypothetical protein